MYSMWGPTLQRHKIKLWHAAKQNSKISTSGQKSMWLIDLILYPLNSELIIPRTSTPTVAEAETMVPLTVCETWISSTRELLTWILGLICLENGKITFYWFLHVTGWVNMDSERTLCEQCLHSQATASLSPVNSPATPSFLAMYTVRILKIIFHIPLSFFHHMFPHLL